MTVLIIGKTGQLGQALVRRAATTAISIRAVGSSELDLSRSEAVHRMVNQGRYAAVVNAAAYTAVDKAESDVDAAFAVNRDGVAHLAEACRSSRIPLIHISTDYVFNGKSGRPYQPDDPIDPLGVYGHSKAAGEKQVRERLDEHIILRTSWLYGVGGHNFVKTILRLARERKEIRVVDDQKGCPTFADDLADAIIRLIVRFTDGRQMAWGTYHYCNAGVISWYRLAGSAIALASRHEHLVVEKVLPITTAEYPTVAPRPAYSALECSSFTLAFDIEMLPWEASLAKMVDALYAA